MASLLFNDAPSNLPIHLTLFMFFYQDLFDTYTLIGLSVRAPFLGEPSRIARVPKEMMELFVPILAAIALEEESLALEEDVVPKVEAEEDVVPEESLFPEGDLGSRGEHGS